MSRGEAVLVDFALLEVRISRGWFSPHLGQSLSLKDRVVVGKLDMLAWVSSTRHEATCQGHAARTPTCCGVMRGRVHACADFKRKD